jgi:hypothetical protein
MTQQVARELDYGIAASVRVYAMIEAMKAENESRKDRGLAQAYNEDAFLEVINREGITHNAILGRWAGVE